MRSSGCTRAKNTSRPTGLDKNIKQVQKALSTIVNQPEIAPYLRRITVDVRNRNWSATIFVGGKRSPSARVRQVAIEPKRKRGSQKIRFELQTDSP
jgi:hypothetical protein